MSPPSRSPGASPRFGRGLADGPAARGDALEVVELVRRGYTEAEIAQLWGGNLLRVLREVERVAAESR